MLTSWSCFSQTDSIRVKSDSTVNLPIAVARYTAHELVLKDALVKENALLKLDTSLLLSEIKQFKFDSDVWKGKERAYKDLLIIKDKKESLSEKAYNDLNKQNKWLKTKSTVKDGLLLALIIFTIIKL